jgi:peptidoglycan/LPS O-acetylase OafA/YrhL
VSYREPPVYIDNLLAIRGLSALGVVMVHSLASSDLSFRYYVEHLWEFGATWHQILTALMPETGKNFVLFFFVHSGYLMGKVFFMGRYSTDRPGLRRFYRGRLLRIAPLLYVNLIACLLLLPSAQPTLVEALGDFLFINNFTGRDINGVTWSLSWEMQYYLLAPFVFLCFGVVNRKVIGHLVALAVLFEILAAFGIKEFPPTEFLYYFLLGFAINPALRLLNQRKFPGSTVLAVVGGFFIGNGVYYVVFNSGLEVIANPLIGITAALTIYLLELPRTDESAALPHEAYRTWRLLTLRFWTWTGILSYGIYLWHSPILLLGNDVAVAMARSVIGDGATGWQSMLIFHAIQLPMLLGVTFLVSLITFFTVETRFRPNLYRWDSSRYVFRHLRRLRWSRAPLPATILPRRKA